MGNTIGVHAHTHELVQNLSYKMQSRQNECVGMMVGFNIRAVKNCDKVLVTFVSLLIGSDNTGFCSVSKLVLVPGSLSDQQ